MKWNTPTETGWFVNLAEGGSAVSIFDPSGNVQGELIPASDDGSESVAGGRKRKSSTAEQDRSRLTFRKGRPASLRLSDGTIGTLIDQKPKAMRRKKQAVRSRYRGQNIPLRSFIGPKGNSPA